MAFNSNRYTESEWLNIFAGNLVSLLNDARMSQKELAEITHLSEGTISGYIHKKYMPKPKALINIAYALDISLDELMDFGAEIM